MTRRLPLFLFAALLGGCLPKTPGELDNGGFTYFCASDKDLACTHDLFGASGVPEAIAINAHFDLRFDPDGSNNTATLVPAARNVLTTELGLGTNTTGFRFTSPGTVAVLAKRGSEVLDFIHVTGAPLDRITLSDDFGEPIQKLTITGSSFGENVTASPRDELGNILAGALDYTWTSSDESVVSINRRSDPNEASLVPEGNGKAVVTVTVQNQTASIDVTVGGQ